jgi:hypothetical protein
MEGARFIRRACAGIGGVSKSGRMLALSFVGRHGLEMVLCMVWTVPIPSVVQREVSVILTTPQSLFEDWPLEIVPRMP